MFVTKATHQKEVGRLNSEIAMLAREKESLRRELGEKRATVDALDKTASKFRDERDAARAELAPLKAHRERANANLAAANAARRAKAAGATS